MASENEIAAYRLLVTCAGVESGPERCRRVTQAAGRICDWTNVADLAEAHGLAPLLHLHLQAAGVRPPQPVRRQLQGLTLRHRRANQIHVQALAEILPAFATAGIPALVLKGAALAHLVYGRPGLRPMRDIDILVDKVDAPRAQACLATLGFHAPLPLDGRLPGKHMAVARRADAGLIVSVEIHHNLFDAGYPASMELESAAGKPLCFRLWDTNFEACTLGYEVMLWHLCQHLTYNASVFHPARLIWVADVVAFAGHYAQAIDWHQIERRYPLVLNVLSLLDAMNPLPAELQEQTRLKRSHVAGIGRDFEGWPRSSLADQHRKGWSRILRDTFLPSPWWLRLHYGLGSRHSLFWHRWLIHPLHILCLAWQVMKTFPRSPVPRPPSIYEEHPR